MSTHSLSFRTKLTSLIFVLSMAPMLGSTYFLLSQYENEKIASLFENELTQTSMAAARLESALLTAKTIDLKFVTESKDLIFLFENPCRVPLLNVFAKKTVESPPDPYAPAISKYFATTLERLRLTPYEWLKSESFRKACQNTENTTVLNEGPKFPFPTLLVLLPSVNPSVQRLALISLDGLGGNSASNYFGIYLKEQDSPLWSNRNQEYPLNKDTRRLIEQTFETTLSSISRTANGQITASALIPPNWVLFSSASEEITLAPIKLLILQNILIAAGFLCLYFLVGKFSASTLSEPLNQLKIASEKLGSGDLSTRIEVHGSDEISIVQSTFNSMVERIVRLIEMTKHQAAVEADMAIAKKVQQWFFPKRRNNISNHEIHGSIEMAATCGGDWWSYIEVPMPGQRPLLITMIADAAGHGISSTLLTAATQGGLAVLTPVLFDTPDIAKDPRNILKLFNQVIHKSSGGEVHMSFFVAVMDPNTDQLIVANGGHNKPYLIIPNADPSTSGGRRFTLKPIGAAAPVLGTNPEENFDSIETYDWKPGYQLFLYTDGLIDCLQGEKEIFNRRSLVQLLNKLAHLRGESLPRELLTQRKAIIGNLPQEDDVTAILCTRNREIHGNEIT